MGLTGMRRNILSLFLKKFFLASKRPENKVPSVIVLFTADMADSSSDKLMLHLFHSKSDGDWKDDWIFRLTVPL